MGEWRRTATARPWDARGAEARTNLAEPRAALPFTWPARTEFKARDGGRWGATCCGGTTGAVRRGGGLSVFV